MTPTPNRAEPLPPAIDAADPHELSGADATEHIDATEEWLEPAVYPDRDVGAGGRQVLGIALGFFATLWLAYSAWSAGLTLSIHSFASPLVAQWIAIACAPLALIGLLWLIFGRTRRKESERFTRSVLAMRSEAQSLETLLQILSERIGTSRAELATIAQDLMRLGDETTTKFGGITKELESSSKNLVFHSEVLDRSAESARNDVGVLLSDLPRAEETARALSEQLRSIGVQSAQTTDLLKRHIEEIGDLGEKTGQRVSEASETLTSRLCEIDGAGAAALQRIGEAEAGFSGTLDMLLDRTATVLSEIRAGIDVQSAAVAALVEQSSAGLGEAGVQAAETLGNNLERANESIATLSRRVEEQDKASQRMIAEIDRGLALIDERFTELAAHGDERANHFLESLTRARSDLDALAGQASSGDLAINAIAERTTALRENIDRLSDEIRDRLGTAIGEAHGSTDRLSEAALAVRPELEWIRDAALEADGRLERARDRISEQGDHLAALLASVDEGVGDAKLKLTDLGSTLEATQQAASKLSAETAPALVSALVQVKEAAAHAAERAREAIEAIIPSSAGKLSEETRVALERVIRESIEERLREVENVAARAVHSAREASDRLTQQIILMGQGASALEQHIEETRKDEREKDSEAFARRVSALIDSMHSAAIDVAKILSDEIDDKAWGAYLKGNRGVFTSRAVRLIDGSETRAIRAHHDSDLEFQRSVNRYIHDFETMLRRVVSERDGGMIAVTLMSSDMGKLYAALAQAIDRRR